ncbi:hypothetical protein CEV32_2773 [Brucella rhizosphaerae]|uniref:Uncharacterized protein n=1 Tax=Brucella rhizosphaerae TaxID=571254 RepID=A0A256EZN4_9HYPH|nr:hypothetical protein CEV32_2773 [Brucella rhizosphaerae]
MEFSTIAIAAEHSVGFGKLPCHVASHTQIRKGASHAQIPKAARSNRACHQ